MLSLLVRQMPIFYGLFSIKNNEQRVRQQDIFAAMGDITQFRHRDVRWEGLIMISKHQMTVFLGKQCDAIVPTFRFEI